MHLAELRGMSQRLTFLLFVAVSLLGLPSAQAQVSTTKLIAFPERSHAISPDGRYSITGVHNDSEPYHTVYLDDRRLKTRRKLFEYGRHIEILWNPDSKSFVLNDYGGSDYSECRIMSVDEKANSIDVWDAITKGITTKEQRNLLENHHVYIAAKEWISPDTLKVKVWGYGEVNRPGFTRFYTYDKERSVRHVKP
jgi:hypothetical protein